MLTETLHQEHKIKYRINKQEIERYLVAGRSFIPHQEIQELLLQKGEPDPQKVRDILSKSAEIQSLTPSETATLIRVTDPELLQEMQTTALSVKKTVYDNRIVTFAPLYLGNYCVNDCLYCGFKARNIKAKRKVLTEDEIREEIKVLVGKIGHKRLIAVYGEHAFNDVDYIISSMKTIYDTKVSVKGHEQGIRRINVNAPPFEIADLRMIREAGIGTYQVFQETYHQPTYEYVHPSRTIKGNYLWRLYAMHRAFEAGIDDVGIGVLFGLYDWKYEMMGLVYHARELETRFGIGPHTVSFPRLEPALNSSFAENSPYKVSDEIFKRVITVIRLAIPYTGMIVTARETAGLRREAVVLGVTQMDASSKIGIGDYAGHAESQDEKRQQFMLGDTRSLDEVIRDLTRMGSIVSFCTAGYRCGRTGLKIMHLLKSGTEGKYCKLNAILTFKEWLDDFASPETRRIGTKLLLNEIEEVKKNMPLIYSRFKEYFEEVEKGRRDIYL